MIVDELRAEERDGDVERSARIRWDDDDFRLRFSVPTEWSGDRDNGSPFLTGFQENRPDNCGRCNKCLRTIVGLHAAGALELATGFPDTIDTERIRAMRLSELPVRLFWQQDAEALEAAGGSAEVAEAIRHSLRRSARRTPLEAARAGYRRVMGREPGHDPRVSRSPILFYRDQTNAALTVILGGGLVGGRRVDRLQPAGLREMARAGRPAAGRRTGRISRHRRLVRRARVAIGGRLAAPRDGAVTATRRRLGGLRRRSRVRAARRLRRQVGGDARKR